MKRGAEIESPNDGVDVPYGAMAGAVLALGGVILLVKDKS
jgi:hypothetical protein